MLKIMTIDKMVKVNMTYFRVVKEIGQEQRETWKEDINLNR